MAPSSDEVPPTPDWSRWLHVAACAVWAAMVGMSVPLELVNTIFLNSFAAETDRKYHAFYVSNLAVAMGGLQLMPFALRAELPLAKPKRCWHFLGGVCSLPAFFTVTAGSKLGTQVVLVVQLASLLGTFFIIDLVDGRVSIRQYSKFLALLVIFGGATLDSFSNGISMSGGVGAIVMLPLVVLSGVGYGLQSKCNGALAESWGSSTRATVASACVYLLCSVPIDLYIYFGCDVAPSLDTRFWYLWFVAGFQSAFYIGSMAYLPRVLGFTGCYSITLVAKLLTSLLIDSQGLSGEVVPVTMSKVVALITVLVGSIYFSAGTKEDDVFAPQPLDEIDGEIADEIDGIDGIDGEITIASKS